MADPKFTPGPWTIDPRHGGDKEIIVRQDGDSWHRLQAAVDCDDCDLDMAIANANLIAAAPDMYAALKRFAAIVPSSLYPADGSEAEPYCILIAPQAGNPVEFTGADLAAARAALAKALPTDLGSEVQS